MKNLWKGFLGCLLAVTLIVGVSVIAGAAPATQSFNGDCGKNATWTYNQATHTLTIHGTGTIKRCKDWKKLDVKHITIQNGISEIGYGSFQNFRKLDTVSIPETVTSIGQNAFYHSGISSVTIGKSVKKIESSVFEDCKRLKTVTWNADTIPNYTFDGCNRLENINIKSNITKIGTHAFSKTALKSFDMPDSVTYVGDNAFSYCKKLTGLTFSKNVTTIPKSVAKRTPALDKIIIKNGTSAISKNAFEKCGAREIILPKSITKIGKAAFLQAGNLTTINLPDSITRIKDDTFKGCTALTSCSIGKSIRSIGECAFMNCSGLNDITVPGNVKVIGYKAFENAGCRKVTINTGVTTIDYWAFNNCNRLQSISISDTVTSLQANSLVNCDNLTDINISATNKLFSSVNGCLLDKAGTTLYVVPAGKKGVFNIPSSVSKIETTAFCGCSKITEITASGSNCFASSHGILYNKNMTTLISCPSSKTGTIIIPATVTKIEASAFQQSKASSIIIPNSVSSIGYCAFEYCKNLKNIKIPGSVRKISNAAFWGCENLKKVTIENGVKKIKRNAFHDCFKLEKVIIPTSVTKISNSAFKSIDGTTFYCQKSSYAMSFAVKHYDIDYKLI